MNKKILIKKQQKAQGLVEYALILVLVAVVVIAVLTVLGPIVGNVFTTINDGLAVGGGGAGGASSSAVASSSSSSSFFDPNPPGLAQICQSEGKVTGDPVNITDPNGYNLNNGTLNVPFGNYSCP